MGSPHRRNPIAVSKRQRRRCLREQGVARTTPGESSGRCGMCGLAPEGPRPQSLLSAALATVRECGRVSLPSVADRDHRAHAPVGPGDSAPTSLKKRERHARFACRAVVAAKEEAKAIYALHLS